MLKLLKEAFEVARRLTHEVATKLRRYYDRRAGSRALLTALGRCYGSYRCLCWASER